MSLIDKLRTLGFTAMVDYSARDDGDGPYIETWLSERLQPTPAQLDAVGPTPPRRMIRKSLVKQRLIDAGLMDAAYTLLTAHPVSFARWFDMDYPEVFVDDPDAMALLAAIGADANIILAP